jgi:hypothetical protein
MRVGRRRGSLPGELQDDTGRVGIVQTSSLPAQFLLEASKTPFLADIVASASYSIN